MQIFTEPRNALIKQYPAALRDGRVPNSEVRDEALRAIAVGRWNARPARGLAHHPRTCASRHHVRPALAGGRQQGCHRRRRDQGESAPTSFSVVPSRGRLRPLTERYPHSLLRQMVAGRSWPGFRLRAQKIRAVFALPIDPT